MKASGLSLQEHHILYDCTRNHVSEEDALDAEIAQRIERWEEKKAEEKPGFHTHLVAENLG